MKQSDSATIQVSSVSGRFEIGQILKIEITLTVRALCIFDPVLRLFIRKAEIDTCHLISSDTHQDRLFFPWLPRGDYHFSYIWPVTLPPREYELGLAWGTIKEIRTPDFLHQFEIFALAAHDTAAMKGEWQLAEETKYKVSKLSWQGGMTNWFHRHFCHAALVIGESFLADSPLLRGRILDVGAGEGITDLGLFLRYRPQELVAMDIVDYLRELPRVAQENNLPLERLPEGFTFVQGSCENIPYTDASFDVVISWGSVEHIAGGYRKALDEVWRVLKPGGLFFVNPGLYYSSYGSHLGEFSGEPHLHLKIPEEKLHELVMATQPRIMDRSGFDVSNADYWRFYQELNRIRVAEFEMELKRYGYTVLRAAIRVSDMVEYSHELQPYSILDLAIEDVFFTLQKPAGVA